MDEPGERVVEQIHHYRILERIGRGGMGEVYRAVDERLGRAVALKLLSPKLAASDALQARMLREARAASALNHPGIVTLHDVGSWQGQVYLVMELVEGDSLAALVKRGVSEAEALRLCAEVAGALGAAHKRGILHRDVKSDNLMRLPDGRVKVLDFGLAKLRHDAVDGPGLLTPVPVGDRDEAAVAATLPPVHSPAWINSEASDATAAGSIVGTPAYMAPEQVAGTEPDATSEVFSLGVVLYELLAGRRPFDRERISETLDAVREARAVPPSEAAPDRRISRRADQVALRALSRDRGERFPDMASFANAARHALRPRRVAPLVAGGLLLGAAVLAAGAVTLRRPPPAAVVAAPAPAPPEIEVRSSRRLTFDPGCEEFPSLTPDGRTVIYDGAVENDYEVLALDIDGGTRRRLTNAAGWDFAPAVSPDGKWVAFVHAGKGGRELRLLSLAEEGAAERSLGEVSGAPSWAPDGSLLASRGTRHIVRWRLDALEAPTIAGSAPEGRVVRTIAQLPDGRLIAAHHGGGRHEDLTLSFVDKNGTITPVGDAHHETSVVVASSGDAIYHARSAGEISELVRRPLDGRPPAVVPGNVVPSTGFAISADARRLVYSTCRPSSRVMRLRAGERPSEVVRSGMWNDLWFTDIDARRLLVVSDRSASLQLWIAEIGGDAREIAGVEGTWPEVSRDGKTLIFADKRRPGVAIMPFAGGEVRHLTDDPADSQPAFSADGSQVVFLHATDGRVWIVPAAGGAARPLSGPAVDGFASSRGSDRVYLQRSSGGRCTIFALDLAGKETPVLRDLEMVWDGMRLSADGRRILFIKKDGGIYEAPSDGSAAPVLAWKLAGAEAIVTADYAPDGDGLIATLAMWDGDLWLAEGRFP